MILAIDPGSTESAFVILNKDLKPIVFEKCNNEALNEKIIRFINHYSINEVAIEMIASYGMSVGKEVFDTCVWIGRFYETINKHTNIEDIKYIYRKEEKINLCGTMKAKDSNIIQALKDRFGDKGTKKEPGWFYGLSKDVWQAYAVGVTYHDLYIDSIPFSDLEGD